ncbi:hypothetical protein M885DRAFT_530229 [Pelagophyceae sp. CCMP2097]|nr:hypothetical protein M885DRAFT_530229 [Pelagophyceae sp. CCMP2097]|mmetsp:Transcript_16656/g.56267  ORF Transcript_16656/g.56267 Transcript_16656/m.56267 type:complete len:281 (+) Transcript_16656:34-876(+)
MALYWLLAASASALVRPPAPHRRCVAVRSTDTLYGAAPEPPEAKGAPDAAPPATPGIMNPKEELMSVVGAAAPPGNKLSADLRSSVLETLMKLEAANPTDAPATSPLLNGVWDVAFSGYAPGPLLSPTRPLALFLYAGGFTPGIAGLSLARMLPEAVVDVGDLTLTIQREQPRAEAASTVSLAGMGAQAVKVKTTLEAESGVRLRETYQSVSALGRAVDIPERLRYSRTLYVTYLDDEVLVVRDDSGVPEILLRKSMPDFLRPDEGRPSADVDDVAPGAG